MEEKMPTTWWKIGPKFMENIGEKVPHYVLKNRDHRCAL
jgi:hypothetical protein